MTKQCQEEGHQVLCEETVVFADKQEEKTEARYVLVRRATSNARGQVLFKSEALPLYKKTETSEKLWTYNERYQVLTQTEHSVRGTSQISNVYDEDGDFMGRKENFALLGQVPKVIRTVLRAQ